MGSQAYADIRDEVQCLKLSHFPPIGTDAIYHIRSGGDERAQVLFALPEGVFFSLSFAYERNSIRATRTSVTFDDLANLRWKCGGLRPPPALSR